MTANQVNEQTVDTMLKAREDGMKRDILAKGGSPLYGENFRVEMSTEIIDLHVLHEPEILDALQRALEVYQNELNNKQYTALTINSYSSAVNRFIDFLEVGQVIPDFDNKPTH